MSHNDVHNIFNIHKSKRHNTIIIFDNKNKVYNRYPSIDWFKVIDNKITFTDKKNVEKQETEKELLYRIKGYVTDYNKNPLSRVLRLYYRETGEFIDKIQSGADGYYQYDLPTEDEINIICMDDIDGEEFNDLIFRIKPYKI